MLVGVGRLSRRRIFRGLAQRILVFARLRSLPGGNIARHVARVCVADRFVAAPNVVHPIARPCDFRYCLSLLADLLPARV